MPYLARAEYPLSQPRVVDNLPTLGFARRRASMLLDDGAMEVRIFKTEEGAMPRLIEVASRERGDR